MSMLTIAESLRTEAVQAGRRLVRTPGFAILAISTLAIGLGINTAMFAVMDALLFRPPFHVAKSNDVVRVQFRVENRPTLIERTHYPNLLDLRASGAFEAIAAYGPASVSIGSGVDADLAAAMLVSHDFFSVLGTTPFLGSLFLGENDDAGASDRAIISHGFWERRVGGNPLAVGRRLTIDRKTYVIAGVAPMSFQGLSARPTDVWLPLDHATASGSGPQNWRTNRGPFWLSLVGRLPENRDSAAAEEQATTALRNRHLALNGRGPSLVVATTSVVPGRGAGRTVESKVALWVSLLSGLVLLIASANVTNLLLVQTAKHYREHAISLSLGASRSHLVQRALADACVIIGPSAASALALSFFLRNAVAGLLLGDIPLSRELFDPRTTGIMLVSALAAFLLITTISLWQLLSIEGAELLSRATNARHFAGRTRSTLLGLQAALCLTLVFIAALFSSSLRRVEALDLGVDLDQTVQVTMNLSGGGRNPADNRQVYEDARAALATHPDVERVALADGSPFMSGGAASPWTNERGVKELWQPGDELAYRSAVGPGFFSAAGTDTLRGRDFTNDDGIGAEAVAIVNAPLARHLWPARDAVGECLWIAEAPACLRVVGVIEGVWKFRALERNRMALYLPLAQVADANPSALFIRPRGDARTFLSQARTIVQSLRQDLPAARVVILGDVVDPEFRPWRLGAIVFMAMAAVAVLIASIGLYSIVAINTTFRVRELGIRIALGAHRGDLIRVVAGQSLVAVSLGLLGGTLVILAGSNAIGNVLFQTSPRDPAMFLGSILMMLLVSVIAIAGPTVRAGTTDPADVLRSE